MMVILCANQGLLHIGMHKQSNRTWIESINYSVTNLYVYLLSMAKGKTQAYIHT